MTIDTRQQRHGLTGHQLAALAAGLERARAEVQQRLASRRRLIREAAAEPTGDEMDHALESTNRELWTRLMDRDSKLLAEIDHARSKLGAGRYGLCERTGEPIGFDRLNVRPWTRYAGAAKEIVEREQRAARASAVVVGVPDDEAA
jgi:DnaK suppressor protein